MNGKVGITGGAGFIGSHVVDYFMKEGEDLKVIDNFSTGSMDKIDQHKGENNFEVEVVDITNYREVQRAIEGVDILIHTAARVGGIGYFHKRPADIIAGNDLMNRNVFKACAEKELDRIVFFSSSMVFERAQSFPTSEDEVREVCPPLSAYGFQKLNGEYYCEAFKKQYDLDYTIVRPFNAVGPRETVGQEIGHAHVIPDLVHKIAIEKQYPLDILGAGNQIRSFTHVSDLARGVYLATFSESGKNEDFNLGCNRPITIKKLAEKIWDIVGREQEIEFNHKESYSQDVQRRVPSNGKAEKLLGWEPEISLDESLQEYIKWYRDLKE